MTLFVSFKYDYDCPSGVHGEGFDNMLVPKVKYPKDQNDLDRLHDNIIGKLRMKYKNRQNVITILFFVEL